MQLQDYSRDLPTPRRFLALMLAGMLLGTGIFAVRATPVAAWTPCVLWSPAPSTDGLWAYGASHMDCPSSPISDWLKSEFVEWLFPGTYSLRDSGTNNTNSQFTISVYTDYYCNGHGTDDWQNKHNGRDSAGGEHGWAWGQSRSLTC